MRTRCCSIQTGVKYAEQLKRYVDHFPRDQLKVILFDDFIKDNRKIYREILDFLGVDPTFEPVFRTHNTNTVMRFKLLRVLGKHTVIGALLRKAMPKRLFTMIKKFVYRLTSKKKKRPPWTLPCDCASKDNIDLKLLRLMFFSVNTVSVTGIWLSFGAMTVF